MKISKESRHITKDGLKVIFLIVLISLIQAASLLAQTNDIKFEHISLEQGLSQTTVYCIFQDTKGFMWFGTRDGLNKYDGYGFTVYKHEPENPNSISNNTIRAIYEDQSGALWIGTEGSLNKFNRQKEEFIHYKNDPNDPNSLSHNRIRTILADQSGTLWIGTNGGGLNKLVPSDKEDALPTFVRFLHDPNNPASLSHNNVYKMLEDQSGMLWIGTTGGGLSRMTRDDAGKVLFTHYRHDPNNPASLSNDNINSIFEDQSGVLWIGTRGGGLDRLVSPILSSSKNYKEGSSPTFIHYRHDPNNSNSLAGNNVDVIYEDQSGILWIGTYGAGLNKLIPSDKEGVPSTFIHYKHDPTESNSLSHNVIRSIYEDQSGVLWIGTSEGGLNKFDRKKRKFTHYKREANNPNSLSTNSVSSFYEDHNGELWIGTYGGGLNKLIPSDKEGSAPTFIHYNHDPNNPNSLSDNVVISIYEDQMGVIWIGTIGGGLSRMTRIGINLSLTYMLFINMYCFDY